MELNANEMYLMAVIETLKKENDDLKEEKMVVLEKLEASQNTVGLLNAEILAMKEFHRDEMTKKAKSNQLEVAKVRNQRNKARNMAQRIENEKLEEAEKTESKIKKDVAFQYQSIINEQKKEIESLKSKASMDAKAQIMECVLSEFDWGYNKKFNLVSNVNAFDPSPKQIQRENLSDLIAKYLNWLNIVRQVDMNLLVEPNILSKRNNIVHAIAIRLETEHSGHPALENFEDEVQFYIENNKLTLKQPFDFTVKFLDDFDRSCNRLKR